VHKRVHRQIGPRSEFSSSCHFVILGPFTRRDKQCIRSRGNTRAAESATSIRPPITILPAEEAASLFCRHTCLFAHLAARCPLAVQSFNSFARALSLVVLPPPFILSAAAKRDGILYRIAPQLRAVLFQAPAGERRKTHKWEKNRHGNRPRPRSNPAVELGRKGLRETVGILSWAHVCFFFTQFPWSV
jgi:hypothetical protein